MATNVQKKNYFCRKYEINMLSKVTNWIKSHPTTVSLVLVIWYLSLFTPPETQLSEIRFFDKWTHLAMYGTLTGILWVEDWHTWHGAPSRWRVACLYLAPVAMSGLIELAQAYCTTDRSGDWLDLGANAVGALLGIGAGYLATRWLAHQDWTRR